MSDKLNINIIKTTDEENEWLRSYVSESWGSTTIVNRGEKYKVGELPTLVAKTDDGERIGFLCYDIDEGECEVVLLESIKQNCGVGTALIEEVKEVAKKEGCWCVWLITTNDNINALRFYQMRGFRICEFHKGAVDEARKLKPEIPEIGHFDIPVHDEIELEYTF